MFCSLFNHISTGVFFTLTHWGRVTHICVSKLTIIGSDNGLSPDRRQAIIWTNAGRLLIRPYGTKFIKILIEILTFSFKKMRLKVTSAKRHPFSLGLNVLMHAYIRAVLKFRYIITNWVSSKRTPAYPWSFYPAWSIIDLIAPWIFELVLFAYNICTKSTKLFSNSSKCCFKNYIKSKWNDKIYAIFFFCLALDILLDITMRLGIANCGNWRPPSGGLSRFHQEIGGVRLN